MLTVYPAVSTARLSAYDYAGYGDERYIGAQNFRTLWDDDNFHQALWNTVHFAVATTVGTVVVGGVIALLIDRRMPLARTIKALVFLPVILPIVFTGLFWVFGLDANFGWVNKALDTLHQGWGQAWLANPALVMWTIEAVTVLQFAGLPMIIILAALQDVPQQLQEAASMDGVSALQRVRYVSLPLVRDVVVTVSLLQIMYGFKVFDQVFVMTKGGPGRASEVLSTYVYRQAFTLQHFGLGAAGALVTCLLVVVVSMAYVTVFRTEGMTRG